MAAVGKRCVDRSNDGGLQELLAFIKRSLSGDKACDRKLAADQNYQFTIYTQIARNKTDQFEVKISQGTTLRLFTQSTLRSPTNINVFMVDDGDGAWYIDAETGLVKHFSENIYTSSSLVGPVATRRIGDR
jgi:hypothetical protein